MYERKFNSSLIFRYFCDIFLFHCSVQCINITFLYQEFQHYNAHFSTYNKASVSLTLEDTSRYLQGRYIESSCYPRPNLNLQNVLLNSKTKTTSCAIQCSGESVMSGPRQRDVWGSGRAQRRICTNRMKGSANIQSFLMR